MKYKIFIAVIIVFGLAVLAATWRQGILRNAHLVTVDLEPYETTVLVNTNDAFVFRHAKGIGIALFDSIDWEQSRYRVRALNPVTGEETSNTVEVRHKQLDLDVISFDTSERDSHYVQAGEVWIPWSYHNPGEACDVTSLFGAGWRVSLGHIGDIRHEGETAYDGRQGSHLARGGSREEHRGGLPGA